MTTSIADYLFALDFYEPNLEAQGMDYDMNEAREDFVKRTIEKGCRVVVPKGNELQIDIDSGIQYAIFLRSLCSLYRNIPESEDWQIEEHASSSGLPNRHITITLPADVTPWQRIALQASLGSDPMRELLSCLRMIRGDPYPTLFVEPAE